MEKKTKTLGRLKLSRLSESELEKREMKTLKGGCYGCDSACSPNTSVGSSAVYKYG